MPAMRGQAAKAFSQDDLAATGVGTWDYDVIAGMIYCDPITCSLYGFSVAEGARGVPISRINAVIHPEDRAAVVLKRALKADRGGLFVNEYRIVRPDGTTRWLLIRGYYEKDAGGRVSRARGVIIDVTEGKQDGFVKGEVFFLAARNRQTWEAALDRAAKGAIDARGAIDSMDPPTKRILRPLVDALLIELGRHLAALLKQDRG